MMYLCTGQKKMTRKINGWSLTEFAAIVGGRILLIAVAVLAACACFGVAFQLRYVAGVLAAMAAMKVASFLFVVKPKKEC